ncbi:MAG: PDZ domain-containing protein [Ruminococcaceae bacterium]|nr:PDZ domain-containing protein [Oscillospiraceae bacterium]
MMNNDYFDGQNHQQDNLYQPDGQYIEPIRPTRKKPTAAMKVTALVLVCALVGGICGFGGSVLADRMGLGTATLQESGRTVSEVEIKKVDGQTLMTPAEVYAATVNSAVSINVSSVSTNIFGQKVESASSGSGFIITEDGYIATNHHVVSGASTINVTLYNGDTYPAKLVGSESDYDLAVLKVEAKDLQAVVMGDSASLNVGDSVLAVGNPLGELTFSMSQGIISSCNRAINVDGTPFNMIQVDCSINPGNSGGPLVNLYGETIGIVSAKYSSYSDTAVEGLGFAIPIGDVQALIVDIMENGQVTNKAYLSINAGTMTEQMASQFGIDITEGVFVYSVKDGGAGDKAGLRLGDVITKVEDKKITSMSDLTAAKKNYRAGDTVSMTVYRDGEYITLSVTFDAQPAEEATQQNNQQGQQQMPNFGFDQFGSIYDYFFGRN